MIIFFVDYSLALIVKVCIVHIFYLYSVVMERTIVLKTLEDTHNFAKDMVGKGYRYFLLEGEL